MWHFYEQHMFFEEVKLATKQLGRGDNLFPPLLFLPVFFPFLRNMKCVWSSGMLMTTTTRPKGRRDDESTGNLWLEAGPAPALCRRLVNFEKWNPKHAEKEKEP